MRRSSIGTAVIGLCTVVVIALGHFAPRLRAQVPGSLPTPSVQQPDLMSALLAEVKAIRVEVRDAARASARSQVLLGRVQLQEMHLGRLDQQLALASARRLEAARDRATTSAQIRGLEHQRTSDMPDDQRAAIDADLRRLRAQLQDQHSLEQQFHRQEGDVTNALSVEEQRLRDLSAQLDALK